MILPENFTSPDLPPSKENDLYTGKVAEVHFTGPDNLDGVGLQMKDNIAELKRVGCEPLVFAADEPLAGTPELNYQSPEMVSLRQRILTSTAIPKEEDELVQTIVYQARTISESFTGFLRHHHIPVAHIRNILSLPELHPGATLGIHQTILDNPHIYFLIHVHDGYWEGVAASKYHTTYPRIAELIQSASLKHYPNAGHVTINSLTQTELKVRFGLEATHIPDGYDFTYSPPLIESGKFFHLAGLRPHDLPIAVMTRIRRNKGLAGAVQLVEQMHALRPQLESAPVGIGTNQVPFNQDSKIVLLLVQEKDLDHAYLSEIMEFAQSRGVDLRYLGNHVIPDPLYTGQRDKMPFLSLYQHMAAILYPPTHEGFGNQAIEAAAYKRPLVMRGYPVAIADIFPHVPKIIRMGTNADLVPNTDISFGLTQPKIIAQTAQQLADVLVDPLTRQEMVDSNWQCFHDLCDIRHITAQYRRLYAQGVANLKY